MEKKGIVLAHSELSDGIIDRLLDTDIDVLGIHPGGGEKSTELLDELTEYLKNPEFQAKLERFYAAGVEIEYELHALDWLLPKALLSEHPDWFRMNATGERVADSNFCVSNREALDYIADRCEYLAGLLGQRSHIYNIWMDDVTDGYCECESCKRLTPSDQNLVFCHAVLKGLRRYDPEAKQCYLAYHQTISAPKNVKPEDGVFLEYAPIQRWSMGKNAEEEFKHIAPLLECFGKKDAKVLEYWVDNSLFSKWKKPPVKCSPDYAAMKRDLIMYRSHGFESITSFGLYLDDGYAALHGDFDFSEYFKAFE